MKAMINWMVWTGVYIVEEERVSIESDDVHSISIVHTHTCT